MYTTTTCPYCVSAKALLRRRNIPFEEIDVTAHDAGARAALVRAAGGRRTVPQIFIGGVSIGGSDELHQLDQQGKLAHLVHFAATG
jgi:glutaredoxin 3